MEKSFVYEIPHNISENFCNKIIDQFEKCPKKRDGVFGDGRVDKNVKTSVDLCLVEVQHDPEWEWIDKLLSKKLTEGICKYKHHLVNTLRPEISIDAWEPNLCDMYDTGYQIQRTDPGGFYRWHNDFSAQKNDVRVLTFIWYLNTLEPEQEGFTEIVGGIKIKPEAGKLLFFPATWTGIHRGGVLKSGKKYIVTGWLHSKRTS